MFLSTKPTAVHWTLSCVTVMLQAADK